ncbi:MAG: FliO/MopB family protein [Peptococcaceae bacterium]|jgi:flagellar protein FliO/FliZ|nr:FliO/MopB family protein [Peptococcaceae bacterium]
MSSDLTQAVVRLLVSLPIVLALIYLVLKYGLARRYMVVKGNGRMKLLEQLPLGPKTTLSLVAFGGKYYLLAHQENTISLVKELDELPEPEKQITGDIMELTPKTITEYASLQDTEMPEPAKAGNEKSRLYLDKLKGWLVELRDLFEKLAHRKHEGKKVDMLKNDDVVKEEDIR